MIGITIGINPIYEALATLSASCLREMTGLEVMIINNSTFLRSGLKHPAALKLRVFDLVKEDNIFFFDADWFCIQNWNPQQFKNNPSLAACHDFVLNADWPNQYQNFDMPQFDSNTSNNLSFHSTEDIRKEYVLEIQKFANIKMNCLKWFNTGMWVANRNFHYEWLRKSLEYYKGEIGHHLEYYEQPAMNKAAEELNININFLNRKFNTLIASRSRWPGSLIGLHVKIKHHPDFVKKVLANQIKSTQQVKEYFCE